LLGFWWKTMRYLGTIFFGIFFAVAVMGAVRAQAPGATTSCGGDHSACRCTPDQQLCTARCCSIIMVGTSYCARSCNDTNALANALTLPDSITLFRTDPSGARKAQEFSVVPKNQ
jgi:hypothetical protein